MKNILKLITGLCVSSILVTATGCIEETFPTNAATEDQVKSSDQAAEAMLWGMHATMNTYSLSSSFDYHYDWGYGSIMHVRDVMTGDMPIAQSGYDQYFYWEANQYQGEDYIFGQFIWYYFWKNVLAANKLLSLFTPEEASDAQKGYLGAAHAFRALHYLDMARMFEFLPNDQFPDGVNDAGNNVTNLTVPITTETTTEEESTNNPRVTREAMAEFILADLDDAEELIPYLTISDHTMPHLAEVYGLKARCYMWLEDYANAQKYARMAIDKASVKPMTQEECLSTSKGFNQISCWMWGAQLVKENEIVQTGILNWASWMSNETSFGYASQRVNGPYVMIDKSLYDRIDDNDFRKLMWKAPSDSPLKDEVDFLTSSNSKYGYFGEWLPTYASVKFRPAEGNPDDVNLAASTAYPLMRVEEMYFIEAEAAEHVTPGSGKVLLENFMNSYRMRNGATYTCTATSTEDVIDEIVAQKRIELWGEGQSFFDIKRLNMSVTRSYDDSNFQTGVTYNTNGRPAWMNLCIVQLEKNSNKALIGYENPDPSGKYQAQ